MRLAGARRDELVNALINELNSGKFRCYDGTRPATPDTALSGNNLLAELTLNATFASAASSLNGTLTANAITSDSAADANGTPTFVRVYQSDGTTVVCEFSASLTGGGGEITFAAAFAIGAVISVTSLTITIPMGT